MTTARQRVVGGILGLALGDALGAPFEFRRALDVPSPIPAFELPWMDRPPGSWTDDTAMARNLWTSLIATGVVLDTDDVLRRHLEWLETSPPDIGSQTVAALREHQRGTPDAAKAVFDRRGPEVSAGNGSVMYCAPLGFAYADRAGDLLEAAPALSAITHWDERCKTACVAVTLTAAALVRGDDPESAVRGALARVADRDGGEELDYLTGAAGIERPIDGPDQGFTLFTAGVALRVAGESRPFHEGLLEIVALGGDTDTNASVAGALLGALHGADALPSAWLDRLVEATAIREEAGALAGLVA
ncbi:MAG TPA: ADP-ribosylglycohydrolase family protein [Microbacterium sp.]|nr:ADP-ribosylglycohydrolase family protein [Microbacterium sp.]